MRPLSELLNDWTDVDVAMHALGVTLGLFPESSMMSDFKGVFWSNNPLGLALHNMLEGLHAERFLEKSPEDSDEDKWRWNADHPTRG